MVSTDKPVLPGMMVTTAKMEIALPIIVQPVAIPVVAVMAERVEPVAVALMATVAEVAVEITDRHPWAEPLTAVLAVLADQVTLPMAVVWEMPAIPVAGAFRVAPAAVRVDWIVRPF